MYLDNTDVKLDSNPYVFKKKAPEKGACGHAPAV